MGMNNIGMNFMGMNPVGPAQMGMNNQPNLMNEMFMDNTSKNIKNIVLPYENKIRELEEIIRQKDFEITVLKQKLNNNISNFNLMNMNPMMMNMNNPNMRNDTKEVVLRIKLENESNLKFVECLEDDKTSIIREKLNINKGIFTCNYKWINENLSIKENEILNGTIIKEANKIFSLEFKDTKSGNYIFNLDEDCSVEIAILIYCFEVKKIYDLYNDKLVFLYNAMKLNIHDKAPLKQKFLHVIHPVIIVYGSDDLIG